MTRAANSRIEFSDDQAMIMQIARDFCRQKSAIPAVRGLLHGANDLNHAGYDNNVWQELVELGWLGVSIPEQLGGSQLAIGSNVAIAEAMGRHLLATPFFSTLLAAQALQRGGDAAQKQSWLPKFAAGTIATLALLDNEDWGDDSVSCTATEKNGAVQLNGVKYLVCDATVAELFIVLVNYRPASGEAKNALAIVTADQLPVGSITPQMLLDETKRAAKVDFCGVTIEQGALLESSRTATTLRDIRLIGALLAAAEATGSAAAALDCIVGYLNTRKQFGKLIGSYQALKHPTVDILCALDSARSLLYHAATVVGDGELSVDAEIACRMAKAKATEALLLAGDRGIQFHGAMGFTYECDAQLYVRRAHWLQQHFGDALHHRKRLASLLLD